MADRTVFGFSAPGSLEVNAFVNFWPNEQRAEPVASQGTSRSELGQAKAVPRRLQC
jgi:hypothetical protein